MIPLKGPFINLSSIKDTSISQVSPRFTRFCLYECFPGKFSHSQEHFPLTSLFWYPFNSTRAKCKVSAHGKKKASKAIISCQSDRWCQKRPEPSPHFCWTTVLILSTGDKQAERPWRRAGTEIKEINVKILLFFFCLLINNFGFIERLKKDKD